MSFDLKVILVQILCQLIQKMPLITKVFIKLYMLLLPTFSTKRSLKNAGTVHFMFGGQFGISQTGSEDGLRSFVADLFLSNKTASANRKRGFYTSCLPNNEGIIWFFVLSSKELSSYLKNSNIE